MKLYQQIENMEETVRERPAKRAKVSPDKRFDTKDSKEMEVIQKGYVPANTSKILHGQ